jgi:anti-anti-sigma factor
VTAHRTRWLHQVPARRTPRSRRGLRPPEAEPGPRPPCPRAAVARDEPITGFTVVVGCVGDEPHVVARGPLDTRSVGLLEAILGPVLELEPRRLVVDLDHVAFMDVAGVVALACAVVRVEHRGTRVVLRASTVPAVRMLRLAGLGGRLESTRDRPW